MSHGEIRLGEGGLRYVLNGEPVEPPSLRTDHGPMIPIEPGDQVRRA